MRMLERVDSPYNEVEVWEAADGTIDFDVTGATHATWHPERVMTGHAWDAITAATFGHPGEPRSLLMLGLGGGTVLRQIRVFHPDLHIRAVEIDPEMVRLARTYMDLDALGVEVVTGDAYAHLAGDPQSHDILIDDLYATGARDVVRPATLDRHRIAWMAERLSPDGILVVNLVTGSGHRVQQSTARAAFCEVFERVRGFRPPLSLNEALCGGPRLSSPRAYRKAAARLTNEKDIRLWKQLRSFSLR